MKNSRMRFRRNKDNGQNRLQFSRELSTPETGRTLRTFNDDEPLEKPEHQSFPPVQSKRIRLKRNLKRH